MRISRECCYEEASFTFCILHDESVAMVTLFSVTFRWRLPPIQLQVEHPCWKDWSPLQRVHLSHHWLLGRSHSQSECVSNEHLLCIEDVLHELNVLHVSFMCAQVPHAAWNPNAQIAAAWGCPFCSPKFSLSFLAQPRCYFVQRNAGKRTKRL